MSNIRNWSYNPTQFETITSVMFKDLLTTYKLGWKTSYYSNTYDFKLMPTSRSTTIQQAATESKKQI